MNDAGDVIVKNTCADGKKSNTDDANAVQQPLAGERIARGGRDNNRPLRTRGKREEETGRGRTRKALGTAGRTGTDGCELGSNNEDRRGRRENNAK